LARDVDGVSGEDLFQAAYVGAVHPGRPRIATGPALLGSLTPSPGAGYCRLPRSRPRFEEARHEVSPVRAREPFPGEGLAGGWGPPLDATAAIGGFYAELQVENQRLQRAVAEASEQQTATSEILRVISSSPTDTEPVFETIAATALRLCNAKLCTVFRFDGK